MYACAYACVSHVVMLSVYTVHWILPSRHASRIQLNRHNGRLRSSLVHFSLSLPPSLPPSLSPSLSLYLSILSLSPLSSPSSIIVTLAPPRSTLYLSPIYPLRPTSYALYPVPHPLSPTVKYTVYPIPCTVPQSHSTVPQSHNTVPQSHHVFIPLAVPYPPATSHMRTTPPQPLSGHITHTRATQKTSPTWRLSGQARVAMQNP